MTPLPTTEEWESLESRAPSFSTKYGERLENHQIGILYGVLKTNPLTYFAFPFSSVGAPGADLEMLLFDCGGIGGYIKHATKVAQEQIDQTGRAIYTYEDVVRVAQLTKETNGTISNTSR